MPGQLRAALMALPLVVVMSAPAWAEDAPAASKALLPGVELGGLIAVIVYGLVGMILSAIGYVVFEKVAPYPVRKEIEEDQNTALGIVIGSVIISIALVVSSAVHGGGAAAAVAGGEEPVLPGVYLAELIAVIVYGVVGLAMSILGYLLFEKLAPYPVRKEIEEDQNTALGVMIGAVIISISLVVSAAIRG